MDRPTDADAEHVAPEPGNDPAVEFLSALQPREPAVRRRAFAALLRAVVAEGKAR